MSTSKIDYTKAMAVAGIPESQATDEYKRQKADEQIGVGKDYNPLEDTDAEKIIPAPPSKKRDKVAICGSASSSLALVPIDDDSIEIWTLAWRQDVKRVDRMFDIHDMDVHSIQARQLPDQYKTYLAGINAPCYLTKEDPEIPNSITYPLKEITDWMAVLGDGIDGYYFASSIAYMMALALYEDYKEIHFYGVDLIDEDEYGYQRPNLEYMIGLARGQGKKVYIPPTSALCRFPYLYGYQIAPGYGPFTMKFFEERLKQYKDKIETALNTAHTADGAKQEAEQMLAMLKHGARGLPLTDDAKRIVST